MKKIIILAFAATMALVSCNKEQGFESKQTKGYSIRATVSDVTKTAYEESGNTAIFSWKTGDRLFVVVHDANSPYSANHYSFDSIEDGPVATFHNIGSTDPDWDAYPRSGFALYNLTRGGSKDNYTVTLPAEYTVSGSDFSAIGIPMIGTNTVAEPDEYSFKTAVGVLKVELKNVPVEARKLVITDASNNLAGTWSLNTATAASGLVMTAATEGTHAITVNFPQQTAGSTVNVYVPVPVGTLAIGTTFDVQNSSGTSIKSLATTSEINVARNTIQPITGISVEDWISLGVGKYMDDHGFYYLGCGTSRTVSDYASVTIEKHATQAGRYRVYRPYADCPDVDDYLPNASDYLYIDVQDDETGIVANHSYKYNGGANTLFDAPFWYYDSVNYPKFNSRIIKKDGEGNICNIQLAPVYFSFYNPNCAQNPKIEIVFPNAEPMLAGVFNYANYSTVSYLDGVVSATVGDNATAIKVKAAATVDAGVAALMADEPDLTFTTSGSDNLDITTGKHFLVYKVETDGHGYTFKHIRVYTDEIMLTNEMISVNVDAGTKDGAWHYDGSGKVALIDNNITSSSFWHTPYYAAATVWDWGFLTDPPYTVDDIYDFEDLDGYYGAYIQIDLGASKTVENFQMRACLCAGAGTDFPKLVEVYASTDATTWNKVGESENVSAGKNAGEWITPIPCTASAAARYIRFCIITNTSDKDLWKPSDQACTHLAEIKFFE